MFNVVVIMFGDILPALLNAGLTHPDGLLALS
jgi:hypothetical protein